MTPFSLVDTAYVNEQNDAYIVRKYITSHRLYPQVKATGYPEILPNYTASFSGGLCHRTRQGSFHLQVLRKGASYGAIATQLDISCTDGGDHSSLLRFDVASVSNQITTFR